MGFRFQKRVRILPGVALNFSKSGVSLSLGPRGAQINIGSQGVRGTVGIPGTGVSYSKKLTGSDQKASGKKDVLKVDFLEKLTLSGEEEALVNGLRAYATGNTTEAMEHVTKALSIPDAAFIAGILALQENNLDAAADYFHRANHPDLGQHFAKYQVDARLNLDITEEITAQIEPNQKGLALALAEIEQARGNLPAAIQHLQGLADSGDVLVRLSLCELLLDTGQDQATCQQVVKLAEGIENDTSLHTALLYYRAKALRQLGLNDAAKDVLTTTLRKKKDRSNELLQALRYERALLLEATGDAKGARKEFEALYAESPDYEDVAARLGLK